MRADHVSPDVFDVTPRGVPLRAGREVEHHRPMASMGVPRSELPHWDDIQLLVAQLASKPLMDDHPVATDLMIGPGAARPPKLAIPLFVSDMSFGALSEQAKIALAAGAERPHSC